MRKQIQLHIPEPCHENWNKMTPADKGRFCGSCQKQVIDFATMNEEQLVAFFRRQSNGSVCGRFMTDQLDRMIELPRKRIPWVRYFLQFALPAFLFSTKATAQGKVKTLGNTMLIPVTPTIKPVENIASDHDKERVIRGKVVDEMGQGIYYASIFIKGTTIGVAADSTGSFSLKYPGGERSIVLVTSSIGFEEVETEIDLTKINESITTSLPADNMLNEVIVVASIDVKCRSMILGGAFGIRVEKMNFIDTVWNKLFPIPQASSTFPNPVRTNSILNVEIGKKDKGAHLFQLSAVNGQVVLSREMNIDDNSRVVKINMPSVPPGIYFLQITNKHSGKRTTEKIIVQ